MRDVDGGYRTAAEKKIRDVGVKILTNDDEAKTIPADRILSISIQRSVSGGSFSIGNAPSDRLNAVIVGTEKLPKKTRITVYINFDGSNWERLGRFYVDSCTRNGQRINVTAYDALSLAEKPVKFGGKSDKGLKPLEFPCLMQEMLDYIVALRGMTCEFACQPFTVYEKPMKSKTEYYTARELFGLIAACHGCNAKINAEGKLIFREFGKVKATLTTGNVLDQMIDDGEPFTVRGVLFRRTDLLSFYVDDIPGSSYDEESDGIVICNNPMATVEIAEYVWSKIGKLSYYGGSVKIRGAGILECGDVVSVKNLKCPTDSADYSFCITDISYSISRENGFIETLSSEVTRRSSTSGSSLSSSLVGGVGIEISGNTIKLKPAGTMTVDKDGNITKNLGGVYLGNGLWVDYDGKLNLNHATVGGYGGISIGNGLHVDQEGVCYVRIGAGMRYNALSNVDNKNYVGESISPNLGDGFKIDPSEDKEDPDYGKIHLNLGKGFVFGAREYDKMKNPDGTDREEDDPTRYTSEVQLKLGKGLAFGANGELISTAAGGKEYKAGENISISDDGTISAAVKEYKAGDNITISNDGTISATGGGAELAAGGGITIDTDEETRKQTVSAAVGEGAEIRDGKICTVPNIQNAVMIQQADAKYLLHNFTQIEYNAGNRFVYAGPGNQIIIQGYLAYTDAFFRETAASSTTAQYVYPIGWEKTFSTYAELSGTFFQSTNEYTKLYLELQEAQPLFSRYFYKGVKSDGTVVTMQSFNIDNYNLWSGVGLAVRWTNIFPPGATFQNRTFEYGVIIGIVLCVYQTASNITARIFNNSLYVPFTSLAEYQAAVGLTYEPMTLT